MRVVIICLLFLLFHENPAQAADPQPGDACTRVGSYVHSGGPELSNNGYLLVCNGTNWVRVFSFTTNGVLKPALANTPSCANNQPITFDTATGGLRCGSADTIAPIWVTPAGVLATVDVNHTVNLAVAASDESGTPSYQKTAGAGWISVAANGAISGKAPATGGTYIVTVRASDAAGNTADRTFQIDVNPPGGPAGCTNHGDVCPDGTVYAGKSPDGNVDFFVTQQDLPGGNWTFSSGGPNPLNTGLADCTTTESTCRTGRYNTDVLAAADSESDAGFQIHRAATACYCLGETHANAPDATVPPLCAGDPAGTNALQGHGYDDWYLPAVAELDVIYVNLVAPSDPDNPTWQDGPSGGGGVPPAKDGPQASAFVGGNGWYRTSSESIVATRAWAMRVSVTGETVDYRGKEAAENLRCARRN